MLKHSIDKIKIFDHFSKKAKITSYRVFRRYLDHTCFGMNVIINGQELCLECNSLLIDFKCKNGICFEHHKYSTKNFPKKFKEAILDTCIELNENILATVSIPSLKISYTVVFIPKASSLEELAIKMELEA